MACSGITSLYCSLSNDAISRSDYTASNDMMINELERIRKEAVLA
jgi:hypothetical protein